MVLEARDVSFAYGPAKWAIRNLTVSLDSPRRVALLGANGVGKSTFMMLINGTLRPQEGQMRVLGQPIDYSRAGLQALHRRVGIVLQDPDDQLFGATVEQDVAFGPLNNGMEPPAVRKLVCDTLERMGIPHLADRPIHELSLGEKKRVALAGILVLRPSIILLDEPTAGLDFAGITAMLNLLDDLYRAGTALIVSTHDTDLAYEWADDAWILLNGALAAQGPIADVVLNEVLPEAHLRVPTMVELGRALRTAHPELGDQPLPRTREAMLEMIQQTGTEPSATPPRLVDRTISTAAPAAKVISFCSIPGGPMAPRGSKDRIIFKEMKNMSEEMKPEGHEHQHSHKHTHEHRHGDLLHTHEHEHTHTHSHEANDPGHSHEYKPTPGEKAEEEKEHEHHH